MEDPRRRLGESRAGGMQEKTGGPNADRDYIYPCGVSSKRTRRPADF